MPRSFALFGAEWPEVINLMASRCWENVPICNMSSSVQSSFFSAGLTEDKHAEANRYIRDCDVVQFQALLSAMTTRLVQGQLNEDWLTRQMFVREMQRDLGLKIHAVLQTLISDNTSSKELYHVQIFLVTN